MPVSQPVHSAAANASYRYRHKNRDLSRQGPQRGPYLLRRNAGIGAGRPRVSSEISLAFLVGRGQSPSPVGAITLPAPKSSARRPLVAEFRRDVQPTHRRIGIPRHGRACPGHPRLATRRARKTWMPGTSPGMTMNGGVARYAGTTSSLMTRNFVRSIRPKLVVSATSAASRPVAIRMRPIRGWLWRASNVYHCPDR